MRLRPPSRSRRPRSRKGLITATTIGLVAAPLAVLAAAAPAQAEPDDSDLVISEVYGGGGNNTGTPAYKVDYVEVYNPTAAPDRPARLPRDLPARPRAASAAARPLRGTLPAGDSYLVQMSSAGTAGADLPVTPDRVASPAVSMATAGGQVLLTDRVVTFPVGDLTDVEGVVDAVGSGDGSDTPNAYEGADGPQRDEHPSVSRAAARRGHRHQQRRLHGRHPDPDACDCTGAAGAGYRPRGDRRGPGQRLHHAVPRPHRHRARRGRRRATRPAASTASSSRPPARRRHRRPLRRDLRLRRHQRHHRLPRGR